jgi:hypothetical protein
MANDARNKFSRKVVATASSDVKELGWGARLDKLHEKGTDSKNRFGDLITERPAPAPIESPKKVTRIGRTDLDPATLAAKEASDASRQAVKDNKARTSRDETIGSLITEQDFQYILIGWAQQHPETSWTLFNLTNVTNVLLNCLQNKTPVNGVTGLNARSLETVYSWAKEQNNPPLLEPFPGQRKRGDMAARKVDYTFEKNEEPTNERVIQRTVVTREENQALRAKPFEQLQAEARANFKPSGRKV